MDDGRKNAVACTLVAMTIVGVVAVTPRRSQALRDSVIDQVLERVEDLAITIGIRESPGGCGTSVAGMLQTIRNQIELYRIRNDGTLPDFTGKLGGTFGDPLADSTELQGLLGPDYLRCAAVNSRTGTSDIIFGPKPTKPVKKGDPAWVWGGTNFWLNGFDEESLGGWIVDSTKSP